MSFSRVRTTLRRVRSARRCAAAVGGLLATTLLVASTCASPPRPHHAEGRGVSVRRVDRGVAATRPEGLVVASGDYVLESGETRVVVGGMNRAGPSRGAVLEAARGDMPAEDRIARLAPRVFVGERGSPVVARRMHVVVRGERPALRIEGEVRIGARRLVVVREMALADRGQWLAIATRVAPGDGQPVEGLRSGARIAWGGAVPVVPGVGPLQDEGWHEANWIARSGRAISTAFGLQEPPLHVRAHYEPHGASRLLSHTDVASSGRDVPAGGALRVRSALSLAPGGISEPVRRIGWSRGTPFPEAIAMLPYAPDGATVTVRTEQGLAVVQGRPDAQGRVLLPLTPIRSGPPADVHVLTATAYGHATSGRRVVRRPGARVRLLIPEGGQLRVRVTDAEGTPMPARARIMGVADTPTPELGPDWSADGTLGAVVTVQGDVVVPVEPGIYRVLVSRGPEWSLVDETVKVTETYRPNVVAKLEHVLDPGDWVGCDLHLHASPSRDSQVSLRDRVASLVAEGVRFAVPTDHNHVTDYAPTLDEMAITGLGTVPGVEVTTWDPQFGHFNAFPVAVDPDAQGNGAPAYQKTTPIDLFAALREASPGVLIQVNHPRLEPTIGYFDLLDFDARAGEAAETFSTNYDLLEVWNGYDIARPAHLERVFQDWLALLDRGERVVATGNSDSHLVRYHWAGYPRTYVQVDDDAPSPEEGVLEGLRRARAFVTNGPFVELWVQGVGIGASVEAEQGKVRARVRVRAPPWMSVSAVDLFVGDELVQVVPIEPPRKGAVRASRRGGRGAKSAGDKAGGPDPKRIWPPSLPVLRLDRRLELDVARDTFVLARVRGEQSLDEFFGRGGVYPHAFTNPVWVRAGGRASDDEGPGAAARSEGASAP